MYFLFIKNDLAHQIDHADEASAEKHAREHIKEKYGVNGYANYPLLYRSYFKIELEVMQQEIENL